MSNLNPKLFDPEVEQVPTRDGYGQGVVALGEKNPNVVVLTGDLSESTRANMFEEKFPERFIEWGEAKKILWGLALGWRFPGKSPLFFSSLVLFRVGVGIS